MARMTTQGRLHKLKMLPIRVLTVDLDQILCNSSSPKNQLFVIIVENGATNPLNA